MTKEEFIDKTAKDYDLSYQEVEIIYDEYMCQNPLIFYFVLQELDKQKTNEKSITRFG